jgi:hypothetical protein
MGPGPLQCPGSPCGNPPDHTGMCWAARAAYERLASDWGNDPRLLTSKVHGGTLPDLDDLLRLGLQEVVKIWLVSARRGASPLTG